MMPLKHNSQQLAATARRTSSVSLDLARLQTTQRRASMKQLMGKMETRLSVLRALCSPTQNSQNKAPAETPDAPQ